jgi:branched-chain amino acid transport system substrate-binding protein
MVGGACASAPGYIEIAGSAAEGTYMSTAAWLDDPRPEVQAYLKKFLAKNADKRPPYSGPRAYDIIYSYKHCFEASGVTNNAGDLDADRDRIRGCLAGLKNFPGVAGEITMDEKRDGAGKSAILKVVNGKYTDVSK